MRYLGGKSRQAKRICSAILERADGRTTYVEPFLGGANVAAVVAPHFKESRLSDVVPDLVLFWKAIQNGWRPPSTVSRDEYESLRQAKPSAFRAWVGFCCSFNGKWWGGYGPTAANRDYLAESLRAIEAKVPGLKGASITCAPYWDVKVDKNCVVYLDPPYSETTSYKAADSFDSDKFWSIAQNWADKGALVLVSEYSAPSGWTSVLDIERSATVSPTTTVRRSEGLYIYEKG